MLIVGIDTGGTFTDLVVLDDEAGEVKVTKVPSNPQNPGAALLEGLEALGVAPERVRRMVHGTTVATNALLERKVGRTGLLVTEGFRDVVEFGRGRRLAPWSMFDPSFVRPEPLVPRKLRLELRERILADGTVLVPLDEKDVERAAEELRRAGVEAVAVGFLHSYLDDAHERLAGEVLRRVMPSVPVSLSAEVVPEYREFERFSTAVLNAALIPVMDGYTHQLEQGLAGSGYAAPFYLMSSSGGIMTLETSRRLPIRTLLSGPVGGVVGSVYLARHAGFADLITCDMGGTSTDVCLVRGLQPETVPDRVVAGMPLKTPQVDINTVGAGGGSIAWLEEGRFLHVGPQSAGAEPGPACYGLGGTDPTVTDANVVLGRLNPSATLGHRIHLRRDLAHKAVKGLASALGVTSVHEAAEGIVRLAVTRMVSAIREISLERGYDPRDFVFVPFGGAGPMHAAQVAEELHMERVLVPLYAGNTSALGLLCSDLRRDYARTVMRPLSGLGADAMAEVWRELQGQADADLAADGFGAAARRFERSLDLRYVGQAFELNLPLEGERPAPEDIAAAFHQRHAQRYGHSDPQGAIEVVNLRLSAFGTVSTPTLRPVAATASSLGEALLERRLVYFGGSEVSCPVYQRERLPEGAAFDRPAIVEEFGATTVVPPGWGVELDRLGNLLMQRGS